MPNEKCCSPNRFARDLFFKHCWIMTPEKLANLPDEPASRKDLFKVSKTAADAILNFVCIMDENNARHFKRYVAKTAMITGLATSIITLLVCWLIFHLV